MEIRRYPPLILAETFVEGDLHAAGLEGYRRLASYISGYNRSRREIPCSRRELQAQDPVTDGQGQRIPMMSPVAQRRCGSGYCISFVMPESFTLFTLPEPSNPLITLREIPQRLVAALRYRGSWRTALFLQQQSRLEACMAAAGLVAAGPARYARYNPPFVPWFLRRNEILIPLR
jgi:hypothetical protein